MHPSAGGRKGLALPVPTLWVTLSSAERYDHGHGSTVIGRTADRRGNRRGELGSWIRVSAVTQDYVEE